MCTSHRRALQPPHPSEPIVGQFFNNPPCQRCVPIYPLRYAIADSPFDRHAEPQLDTRDYPALQGDKHYGLRPLRPGSYVYLFHFKDGRMWTQHYLVTEDARFAALWWSLKDRNDATPGRHARPDRFGATAYLPAPETSDDDTVWLLVSDTLLSHCTLWKIEQDTRQLRSRLATRVQPAGGAGQAHVLPVSRLNSSVPELSTLPAATFHGARFWAQAPLDEQAHPLHWSESQPNPVKAAPIEQAMHWALMGRTDLAPLAVVLQDPVGITSELNHLATRAVQAKARFAAESAHRLSSAQLIHGYFQQLQASHQHTTLARQQQLVRWEDAERMRTRYPAQINSFDPPIERAVADVLAWVRLSFGGKLLDQALSCFDLSQPRNARDYEEAVFQCIGALAHSAEGRQRIHALVSASPEYSHYWLALAQGNRELLTRLNTPLAVSKGVFEVVNHYLEEHAATPATNALISLLQAVPTERTADLMVARLRHVLEMRFNATLVQHDVSAAQYLRFARELQGYQALGPELRQRWNLSLDSTVTADSLNVRLKLYEWVKVGETEYRVLDQAPAERPALPPKRALPLEGNPLVKSLERMRGPAGYLFTGLGGFLAVVGMGQAKAAWDQAPVLSNLFSVVGSHVALIGASVEIGAAGTALVLTNRGKAMLATSVKALGTKLGTAYLGAGGVALATVSDGIKSVNAAHILNPEQSRLYLGAALAGSAMTLSTAAGGLAAAASIPSLAAGGGAVAVLGLTPAGWAIIALSALGTSIYFSLQADEAEHGPVDIWLKHSIWGLHGQRYTHIQELEAFHSLLYRPRIAARWTQPSGYGVGTLTISCRLPSSMTGERLAWDMRVTLAGQKLVPVQGPIMATSDSHSIDYRRQYLVSRGATLGAERSWAITMHEDAQVAVEYLYQPNPDEQPDLAVSQPGAPAPLIFTAGGWFSDPIDKNKIAPVEAPK